LASHGEQKGSFILADFFVMDLRVIRMDLLVIYADLYGFTNMYIYIYRYLFVILWLIYMDLLVIYIYIYISIGDLYTFMDLLASNPKNTPFNDMMDLFV